MASEDLFLSLVPNFFSRDPACAVFCKWQKVLSRWESCPFTGQGSSWPADAGAVEMTLYLAVLGFCSQAHTKWSAGQSLRCIIISKCLIYIMQPKKLLCLQAASISTRQRLGLRDMMANEARWPRQWYLA